MSVNYTYNYTYTVSTKTIYETSYLFITIFTAYVYAS